MGTAIYTWIFSVDIRSTARDGWRKNYVTCVPNILKSRQPLDSKVDQHWKQKAHLCTMQWGHSLWLPIWGITLSNIEERNWKGYPTNVWICSNLSHLPSNDIPLALSGSWTRLLQRLLGDAFKFEAIMYLGWQTVSKQLPIQGFPSLPPSDGYKWDGWYGSPGGVR